jgi:hypothetical protein
MHSIIPEGAEFFGVINNPLYLPAQFLRDTGICFDNHQQHFALRFVALEAVPDRV